MDAERYRWWRQYYFSDDPLPEVFGLAQTPAQLDATIYTARTKEGMEQGLAEGNPCREVRRNTEKPRSRLPSDEEIASFLTIAAKRGAGFESIGIMGQFAALTGGAPGRVSAPSQKCIATRRYRLSVL